MKQTKDPVQVLYDKLTEEGYDEVRAHKTPPRRIRASEAADCVRKVWYRLSGYRPAPTSALLELLGIQGDIDHDITRRLFHDRGIEIRKVTFHPDGRVEEDEYVVKTFEVELDNGETVEVKLSGRCDGEIDVPEGVALLEIKGMSHWPYDWLNKAFEKDGAAGARKRITDKHPKYEWQCQVTMKLYGFERAYLVTKDRGSATIGIYRDIKDAKGKPTGNIRRSGIVINDSDDLWLFLLKRFAYILRQVEKGTPPPKEFAAGSNECKYCNFRYRCHEKDERMEKKKRGLLPKDAPDVVYPGPQIDTHLEAE